jgi:hypothetical protein
MDFLFDSGYKLWSVLQPADNPDSKTEVMACCIPVLQKKKKTETQLGMFFMLWKER